MPQDSEHQQLSTNDGDTGPKLTKNQAATASSTQAVHAGEKKYRSHDSLTVPLVQTSVFTYDKTAALIDYVDERMFVDEPQREEYGRYGNPTVRAVEAKLAEMEGAQDAILVSSGMAAITTTLLLMLSAGDHMILTNECYLSTLQFCQHQLSRYGISCTVVPYGDYEALEAAMRPNTRLVFSESPTNPFMHCLDFARFADIARRHDVKTVVDTTIASHINLQALSYGVDLVIHSVTKYLAGHNDVMAGAIVGPYELTTPLRQAQGMLGSIVDPHSAYLILRGCKTLGLRMRQQNLSATTIAEYLEEHAAVRTVWYPCLESHCHHDLAATYMSGCGGVVSFEIDGDAQAAYRFIDALQIPTIGPSLGGVETLVSPLALMGYANLPPEERESLGIRDELVRLCVGIEDTQELIDDLAQALQSV
jgi:cystathionine gamma-synthase